MAPIDYRRTPGRPGRGEPAAPATRIRVELPDHLLKLMMEKALKRGLSRQAAIREAVAQWVEDPKA